MQSFVYIIMPFLLMGGVIVGAFMWGGGRLLDGARAHAQLKAAERRLAESNDLLKEIAGQAVTDASVKMGLGTDMLDRIAEQTDANDTKLARLKVGLVRRKELT